MGSIHWPKVVLTGALAALLVPLGWAITRFVTLGTLFAVFFLDPNLNERLEAAAIADFVLWFAFVWGARGLWIQFRHSVKARGAHWAIPLRHAAASVVLFSLQLSFYGVFGLASLPKVKGLAVETWFWATTVSLIVCVLVICCLFLLAVRLCPASWARRWDSEKPKFTTLNLQ